MTDRAEDRGQVHDSIHEMVRRIAAQFRPDKIILFDSHARGDARPDSDVDLLIVMPVQGSKRQKATEIDMALADRTVSLDLRGHSRRLRTGSGGNWLCFAAGRVGGQVLYNRAA